MGAACFRASAGERRVRSRSRDKYTSGTGRRVMDDSRAVSLVNSQLDLSRSVPRASEAADEHGRLGVGLPLPLRWRGAEPASPVVVGSALAESGVEHVHFVLGIGAWRAAMGIERTTGEIALLTRVPCSVALPPRAQT